MRTSSLILAMHGAVVGFLVVSMLMLVGDARPAYVVGYSTPILVALLLVWPFLLGVLFMERRAKND